MPFNEDIILNVPLNIKTLKHKTFNFSWNNNKIFKRQTHRNLIQDQEYKSLRIFLYFDFPSINLLVVLIK